jgi:hypothetical protein
VTRHFQLAARHPTPDLVPPELATLVDQPPDGDGWVHEIKLDGYHAITTEADKALEDGALAMAWTCIDLAKDHEIRKRLMTRQ